MRRLLLLIVLLLALVGAGVAAVQLTQARARLLVQFPDGRVENRTITFRNNISGLEMLQRSGLNVVTSRSDFGTAVCSIEGVGCPATNCFCDKSNFWGYYHWTPQGWAMSDVGADQASVTNGGLDGWRWGDGPPTVNGGANAPATPARSATAALGWLRVRQQSDGGFASDGFRVGLTLDATLAASAAGEDVGAWHTPDGHTVLDFLAAHGSAYLDQGGAREAGKLLAGVVAAGGQPGAFAGRDLVQAVRAAYRGGQFGQSNWDQAWAMLGLAAAGETIPAEAVQTLLAAATPEGGWAFAPEMGQADVDSTGLALQALAAAGAPHDHPTVQNAKLFLSRQQNDDAGFPTRRVAQTASRTASAAASSPSNAPSTALAVMGLLAVGENPLGPAWQKGGRTPVDALAGLQGAEGGLRGSSGANDLQATAQAVPALLGKVYPPRGLRD